MRTPTPNTQRVSLDVQSDEDHEEWPDVCLTDDDIETHEDTCRDEIRLAPREPRDRRAGRPERPERPERRTRRGQRSSLEIQRSVEDDGEPSTSSAPSSSAPSSPSYNSSEDEEFQSFSGDVFVKHRVHQKDTLASLAVRYNVSISDIKRANGYQNESALYGKEWVVIPKKPLPIDVEHVPWVGMNVISDKNCLNLSRLSLNKKLSPRMATLDEEDRAMLRAAERRERRDRLERLDRFGEETFRPEVEMMRPTGRPSTSMPNTDRDWEDVRTAARTDSQNELNDPATREFFDALREKDAANSTPQLFSAETSAKLNAWKERSSTIAMKELKNFQGRSIRWRDTIVNKLKRIGSQPAMAGGTATGASVAAGHVRAVSLDAGSGGGGGLKTD